MGKKKNMAKCIAMVLLAACLILSAVPADNIMAEETDVMKETYKGATFYYQKIRGYKDSVVITGAEIIGVTVPKGTTVLKIPEILGKKKVISVDLANSYSVTPDKGKSTKGIKNWFYQKN